MPPASIQPRTAENLRRSLRKRSVLVHGAPPPGRVPKTIAQTRAEDHKDLREGDSELEGEPDKKKRRIRGGRDISPKQKGKERQRAESTKPLSEEAVQMAGSDDEEEYTDLNTAVLLCEQNLDRCPPGHSKHYSSLINLANALVARFKHTGQPSDLDKVILFYEAAHELLPSNDSDRPGLLRKLATGFFTRFQNLGEFGDLDRAVRLYEKAHRLHPRGHPERAASLSSLSDALLRRFEQLGKLADLNRATRFYEQALNLRAPGHPDRSESLDSLASALLTRFEQSDGQSADLERAVLLYEQALAIRTPGHDDRSESLNNLATALLTRYDQSGQLVDLERGVLLLEKALELFPPGHLGRSTSLSNLGNAVLTRYKQLGRRSDLDKAILLYKKSHELLPPGNPERSASLSNHANAVLARFDNMGKPADLDEAIMLYEEAHKLFPIDHPDRSRSFINLGNAVLTRFNQSGLRKLTDLHNAVLLLEQALKLCPSGHPGRPTALNNYAKAISRRFEQSGQFADLDKAVLLFEQASELGSPNNSSRSASLSNLANVLLIRFEQSGKLPDLDRAVTLHEQVLRLRPTGHPDRSRSLSNLGNSLLVRSEQSKELADFDGAVLLNEQSLELLPPNHPNRPASLTNLAVALVTRFEETKSGRLADVEKANRLHQEALEILSADHPDRSESLCNFALALKIQSEQTGQTAYLDQAISRCQEGLKSSPHTHPVRTRLFLVLGRVYISRFRTHALPLHLDQALDALSHGAHSDFGLLLERYEAAEQWMNAAIEFSRQQSAVTACQVAVELLPRLIWLGLDLQSRLQVLNGAHGLLGDGAACAVHTSNVMKAIELLEAGRGVFWTHALQLQTKFDYLPSSLSKELIELSQTLHNLAVTDSLSSQLISGNTSAEENVHRRALNDKWLQTLEKVRKTPGFEYFFRPKPYTDLAAAAEGGPVVILTASPVLGCDAIVIRSQRSPAEHVALPGMTFDKLGQLKIQLWRNTRMSRSRHMGLANGVTRRNLNEGFVEVLGTLWTLIAKPIIDYLGLQKSDDPKRLWWCPTSQFAFMPIHAAGLYNDAASPNMFQYAVSSYTPTLDALIAARSRTAPVKRDKVLVVIQPETPGQTPLKNTLEERRRIAKVVLPDSLMRLYKSRPDADDGSDATVENVLSRLPEASIVHFACHAVQNTDEPLKSALLLYDGKLTLERMMHHKLKNASFAFLSACQSATGDQDQPDEIVHLGAAMLVAGFKSVIATMWSMRDEDGPLVAEEVYTRLFKSKPDLGCTAHALHEAVSKLRATGAGFASWVPFVHLGV